MINFVLQKRLLCDYGQLHLAKPEKNASGIGAVLEWMFQKHTNAFDSGRLAAQMPLGNTACLDSFAIEQCPKCTQA